MKRENKLGFTLKLAKHADEPGNGENPGHEFEYGIVLEVNVKSHE